MERLHESDSPGRQHARDMATTENEWHPWKKSILRR
jgi:hypothetical protein